MTLTPKGRRVLHAMRAEYGKDKGTELFKDSQSRGILKGTTKPKMNTKRSKQR